MGVTSYLTVEGEILSETRSGVESDYVPYPIGSTAALLSLSQTITDTFTWWPYGEQRAHSGSSVTPFGYEGTLGYFTDSPSDRIYVERRVLRPATTQWQSRDLIWPRNAPFGYARSRPTTLVDQSGLAPIKTVNIHSNRNDRFELAKYDDCMAATLLYAYSLLPAGNGVLANFNACVAQSGMKCPVIGQSELNCLVGNLCDDLAFIYLKHNDSGEELAGYSVTPPLIGCPRIWLYWDQLDNTRFNSFHANAHYHIVLMHEALHTCGVDHPDHDVTVDKKCNDIIACCMLRAVGFLPAGQRCKPLGRGP